MIQMLAISHREEVCSNTMNLPVEFAITFGASLPQVWTVKAAAAAMAATLEVANAMPIKAIPMACEKQQHKSKKTRALKNEMDNMENQWSMC